MESHALADPGPGDADELRMLDSRAFRKALGRFPTGVTVLGVRAGGRQHAMTANSFTSVSLDPPLVLVCVARHAVMHGLILEAGRWAVSVLGADQEAASRAFAHRGDATERLAVIGHHAGVLTGAPLISGSLAAIECATTTTYPAGDHTIVVGEVLTAGVARPSGPALVFHRGDYSPLG